jgi:hypothetical protein
LTFGSRPPNAGEFGDHVIDFERSYWPEQMAEGHAPFANSQAGHSKYFVRFPMIGKSGLACFQ